MYRFNNILELIPFMFITYVVSYYIKKMFDSDT